jgi:hypothetical protein
VDAVFPINLQDSGFYAFSNQICVDGTDYVMVDRRNDKYGVPFLDFVATPSCCGLELMYKEEYELANVNDTRDAVWRYLSVKCPAYRLSAKEVDHATQRAAKQAIIDEFQPERLDTQWGIHRGFRSNVIFFSTHQEAIHWLTNETMLPTEKRIKVGYNGSSALMGYRQIAHGWKVYYYYL